MQNDGTHSCKVCRQPLNESDRNCWKCGSKDILDLRPPPEMQPVGVDKDGTIVWEFVADQAGAEEVLRRWATGPAFGGTT